MLDQVYLDFSKAFDKVPHQRLILKLQNIGVKGKLLSWIESFLTNRMQSVKVNGIRSFCSSVLSGVPQGFVLLKKFVLLDQFQGHCCLSYMSMIYLTASQHVLAKYLLMTPRLQAKSTLVTKLISCKKI